MLFSNETFIETLRKTPYESLCNQRYGYLFISNLLEACGAVLAIICICDWLFYEWTSLRIFLLALGGLMCFGGDSLKTKVRFMDIVLGEKNPEEN